MKYYINNCFFVRVTNESIEKRDMLEKMYKGEISINDFIEMNPQFLEALMNSNYLLYQLIKDNQVSENQKKTIARYFQRSIIRPTPYGLFAGITTGNFGEYTDFCRKSIAHKVSMVDSEWFYLMIKEIEETLISLEKIKLKYNNQCIISGEKIINPYLCIQNNNTDQDKTQKIIARYTEQVKRIVKLTSEWKDFKEIKEYLMEKNPEVEEKVILKFIKQLIKNEILISECRIAITEKDLLKELIKVLEQYKDIDVVKKMVDSLKQIDLLHRRYDNADAIQSIKIYDELHDKMQKIQKSENSLNVLLGIDTFTNNISKNIKKELEDFLDILVMSVIDDNESKYLKQFKMKFTEKYGEYREINLLELMDEHMGLGNPYKYYENIIENSYKRTEALKDYIKNQIFWAVKEKKNKIFLSKSDIVAINDRYSEKTIEYSKSFEINASILAKTAEDIDNGNYKIRIAPCCASEGAGRMINRFYNTINDEGKNELKKIYEELEEKMYDDVDNADITYLSHQLRTGNICSGKRNYRYSVSIGTAEEDKNKELKLSQISVGYDSITNRLYLKNKISGKKLRIVSDNMLTMNVEHYVVRFLREVTFANEKHPSFFWSLFSELDYRYIPEIMYNCIIIYPETWKVYKQDILNWNIFDDFRKEFDKYMGKWKIPKKINLLEGDRYLEFDLELMECWKDLYQEMKRIIERTGVCIIQKSNVDNECWVIDEHGEKYYAEFVFECMGNEKKNFKNIVEHPITKSNIHLNKQNLTILPEMRNYQPGMQGWIYLKIYICEEVADEFIYSEMCGFINNLKDKKILKQWFFIRYSDPDFHIRLRIKAIEAGKLFLEISEWIEKIKKAEKIGRIIIDTYEREIERYGGINSIEYAEQVFMADGLAGAGMYLLQCDKCEKRNKILRQIINYLAGIILEEHDYKGEKVPNWFILPENHYTDNDKRYYKNGSLDFSVSHGIASIYVFMGNAYLQLIEPTICAGVMEAIENTYQMFRVSENGIYYYPGKLRWEEYKLNKTDFMNYRQSWCYGTIGIEGTFFKISCQLKKYKKSNEIYQNIIKISEKNIEEYELESPIVCHGYAGILAIFLFTYKVKPNIKLKNQIIKLTEILIELYDKDAKFGYKDIFYSEKKGNWEKIFREDNSFLEGSSGIILVLVSLLKNETNFQKLLLL